MNKFGFMHCYLFKKLIIQSIALYIELNAVLQIAAQLYSNPVNGKVSSIYDIIKCKYE